MDNSQILAIRDGASTASQIASLCKFMSEALGANPDTSHASEALDGLRTLAIGLSNDLHNITEGN
jgi:hypothetical protein